MNKQDVISFFDRMAPQWDADLIRHDDVIQTILDKAGVREGVDVLDVACGTGVLFPDYLARNVGSVTAVDISPEMVKLAREKFPQIEVLCGDVETLDLDRKFDCIMVYNAFPHFPDPKNLLRVLSGMLKPNGTLTVAHGMSRARIDRHHEGPASKVSVGLMHEDALEALFNVHLQVTVKISNDRMYQVTGVLTEEAGKDPATAELKALVKYMVSHNAAHAEELLELAKKLEAAGNHRAYHKILTAISDFRAGNELLAAALEELQKH